jgi:outer membrane lipoprotein-sorting protein
MKSKLVRVARAMGTGALMLSVPVALVAPATPALAAAGDLDRAADALRAIETMRADFRQLGRNGQQVTGTMTLKHPGKIRFQYQKGVPMLIVSDGSRLTMIDYEVRQKQVWPVKNSPLGALLDPSRDISRYGKLMPTNHPEVVSVRVNDPKHPEYGTLTMIFRRDSRAPGGLELESWVAVDSQNNVTKVFLENHRYGLAVDDNTFRYKDVESRSPRSG